MLRMCKALGMVRGKNALQMFEGLRFKAGGFRG